MLALSLSDKFCCFGIFVFVFVNKNHTVRGLTHEPKFTEKGDDLWTPRSTILQILSPCVNPRPRYPSPNILRTKKQTEEQTEIQTEKHNITVTGISPACLSACGDNDNNNNKYASYPDWHIFPHADRRHRPVCDLDL